MDVKTSKTFKVEFELSEADLAFFQDRLKKAHEARADVDEDRILAGLADMFAKARASSPPAFVETRIQKLGPLIAMLEDKDWRLEGRDRARILDALAYFSDPEDIIPDRLPGIGYLDDAIMIDLVVAGLGPDLEAYADFAAHREELRTGVEDVAPLEEARRVMQARMRRRYRRSHHPHVNLNASRPVAGFF